MGNHSLLQGIFPTNLSLLHCSQILYPLSYQESPGGEGQKPFHGAEGPSLAPEAVGQSWTCPILFQQGHGNPGAVGLDGRFAAMEAHHGRRPCPQRTPVFFPSSSSWAGADGPAGAPCPPTGSHKDGAPLFCWGSTPVPGLLC